MKRLGTVSFLLCLLFLAGCEDKAAETYADKLKSVLQSYQEQIEKKVQAEEESYRNFSSIYGHARTQDTIETLYLERLERANAISDKLLSKNRDGGDLSLSEIQAALKEYASYDFEQTRTMFEQESATQSQYLADLESLDVETANIQALIKSLDDLAKPKGRVQRLKDLSAFAQNVDLEYQKLSCADLAKQKKCLEAEKAQEEKRFPPDKGKIANLSNQIKRLDGEITERDKAHKCPDLSIIECPQAKPGGN